MLSNRTVFSANETDFAKSFASNDRSKQRRFKGGEPSNVFHELRRYLLGKGLDSRVSTFGCISIPIEIEEEDLFTQEDTVSNMFSADNSCFFEMRKTVDIDHGRTAEISAMMFRVFFSDHQYSQCFIVQIIPVHYGDGIFGTTQMYSDLANHLDSNDWSHPDVQRDETTQKIMYFEKKFDIFRTFVYEFEAIYSLLLNFGLYPNMAQPICK